MKEMTKKWTTCRYTPPARNAPPLGYGEEPVRCGARVTHVVVIENILPGDPRRHHPIMSVCARHGRALISLHKGAAFFPGIRMERL